MGCDHPTPAVSAYIYIYILRECKVRTRLVSIPLSSPSLLRTCVIEEENRETEIEVGVRGGKGQGGGGGSTKGSKMCLRRVMANKKGMVPMINRPRKKETKDVERRIVKNRNYAERERESERDSRQK